MTQTDLDLMTIYAYADRNYADERESWREFLEQLLPLLFQVDHGELQDLIEDAVCPFAEPLLEQLAEEDIELTDIGAILRTVSLELAEILGLQREFGLAAFLEGDLPTKVYAIRKGKPLGDMQSWIMTFAKVQTEPEVENKVQDWKHRMETALQLRELQESA